MSLPKSKGVVILIYPCHQTLIDLSYHDKHPISYYSYESLFKKMILDVIDKYIAPKSLSVTVGSDHANDRQDEDVTVCVSVSLSLSVAVRLPSPPNSLSLSVFNPYAYWRGEWLYDHTANYFTVYCLNC